MDHVVKKILIVEDDSGICDSLLYNLNNEGYSAEVAHTADEAMKRPLRLFDLLLINVNIGPYSGFRLAENIRNRMKINVPVIFTSSDHNENDLLTGFRLDADDFIFKPYSINEVLVRMKAVLSRYSNKHSGKSTIVRFGKMELDTLNKRMLINDEYVALTRKEFEMLWLMLKNNGRIITREEIVKKIWGKNSNVKVRTVDVHISRLKNKLGESGDCLHSKTGYGYYIE